MWLGISSGIVVFVVALTGTIFVYCDEVIDAIAGNAIHVTPPGTPALSPEQLISIFRKDHPDRKPFYFTAYKDPARSFKIASADKQERFAFTWVNPYTGATLKTSTAYYFFYVTAHIHSGHIPFGETGSLIVQISTWIFLIELITGLVLWWPRKWTKATRDQSFKVKWRAKFKRVNYDLHNVIGFYSLIPAIMLTVTGLIIVNKLLNDTTHKVLGGQPDSFTMFRKLAPAYEGHPTPAALTPIIERYFNSSDDIQEVRLTIPPKDSMTFFFGAIGHKVGLKGLDGRMMLFNRFTGEEFPASPRLLQGADIERVNMNLHIGFWSGWLGKLITFICGLICTSLPVTGFLIWIGRKNKKTKPVARRSTAAVRLPESK